MLIGYRFVVIYTLLCIGLLTMGEVLHLTGHLSLIKIITIVFALFCLLKALLEVTSEEKIQAFLCSLLLFSIYLKLHHTYHFIFIPLTLIGLSLFYIYKFRTIIPMKRLTGLTIVTFLVILIPDHTILVYLE